MIPLQILIEVTKFTNSPLQTPDYKEDKRKDAGKVK